MIGWLLLGRASGRRAERRRLEEQAERQRLRAPEPGPAELPDRELLSSAEPPNWVFAILALTLGVLSVILGAWAFWVGLLAVIVLMTFALLQSDG